MTSDTHVAKQDFDPTADSGWGTDPGMWQMVSEALDGVKLTDSVNEAIYALCEGRAKIETI